MEEFRVVHGDLTMNEEQDINEEEEVKQNFLEHPDQCPFCENTKYSYETESSENEEIIDKCTCLACNRVWYAVFALSDCLLNLDQL